MSTRWLCLLLIAAFMFQSLVAEVGVHEIGHLVAEHQTVSLDSVHASVNADHAIQDCDLHRLGNCCHGHFSAVLSNHTFDFSSVDNLFTVDYAFFIPSSPSSELLRPPTA